MPRALELEGGIGIRALVDEDPHEARLLGDMELDAGWLGDAQLERLLAGRRPASQRSRTNGAVLAPSSITSPPRERASTTTWVPAPG